MVQEIDKTRPVPGHECPLVLEGYRQEIILLEIRRFGKDCWRRVQTLRSAISDKDIGRGPCSPILAAR